MESQCVCVEGVGFRGQVEFSLGRSWCMKRECVCALHKVRVLCLRTAMCVCWRVTRRSDAHANRREQTLTQVVRVLVIAAGIDA